MRKLQVKTRSQGTKTQRGRKTKAADVGQSISEETTRRRGKTTQTMSNIGRKGEIVFSTATGERRQTKRKRKIDHYGI